VEVVLDWLREQRFSEDVCQSFEQNKIDGDTLCSLSERDLKEELHISALGDRRKIIKCREAIQQSASPDNTKVSVVKKSKHNNSVATTPASESSCVIRPSLADGPSKRQHIHCEVLPVQTLVSELGYGGPIKSSGLERDDRADDTKIRIRKMLDLAFHPTTPEAEQTQALRNAQRLMQQHALSEEDIQVSVGEMEAQGGLFAAKLTPCNKSKGSMPLQRERWLSSLAHTVCMLFDTGSFNRLSSGALYYGFYGRSDAAESAAYAFACACNRMLWMAGSRALPADRVFNFGNKHRGEKFSSVFKHDADYVDWAKRTEYDGAGECLQNFIEYVRAKECPAAWDRAYLEGMAETLHKQNERNDMCDGMKTLAVHSKSIQQKVLEHFGVNLHRGKKNATTQGLRKARSAGSRDAGNVNLGQKQIDQTKRLSIKQ
jgi:hypothetical protein